MSQQSEGLIPHVYDMNDWDGAELLMRWNVPCLEIVMVTHMYMLCKDLLVLIKTGPFLVYKLYYDKFDY